MVHPKMFPLGFAAGSDDVICCHMNLQSKCPFIKGKDLFPYLKLPLDISLTLHEVGSG